MEDIKMSATKAPYAKLKQELDAAFLAVMGSMNLEEGPQVQHFARSLEAYLQVPFVLPCANGTEAFRTIFSILQLPSGAEVVVPAFGDVSVLELLLERNLKPAFADVDAATFTVNPASAEKAVSIKTAAFMATHLFGQTSPMHELIKLAQQQEVLLLEDATLAFGATYVGPDERPYRAGTLGHAGITSFFPVKPTIDSGEGAAVLINNNEQVMTLLKRENDLSEFSDTGIKSRLGPLDAAMLDVKIKYIDSLIKEREEVARYYDTALKDNEQVHTPYRADYSSHVFHQYTIKVPPKIRNGLQEYLRDNFIPSVVYYTTPLHLQEQVKHLGYKPGDFPISENLAKSVLSLPMHTELKQDQLEYICHHILTYVKRHI